MTDTPAAPRSPPMTPPDLARGLRMTRAALGAFALVAAFGMLVLNQHPERITPGVIGAAALGGPSLLGFLALAALPARIAERWRPRVWLIGLVSAAPLLLFGMMALAASSPRFGPDSVFAFIFATLASVVVLPLTPFVDHEAGRFAHRLLRRLLVGAAALWLAASVGFAWAAAAKAESAADGRPFCLLEPRPDRLQGYRRLGPGPNLALLHRTVAAWLQSEPGRIRHHLVLVVAGGGPAKTLNWSFRAFGFVGEVNPLESPDPALCGPAA